MRSGTGRISRVLQALHLLLLRSHASTETTFKNIRMTARPNLGTKPTAISLFAGAGGCSLGFQQAGFDVRFATDIDRDAMESSRRNFAGTPYETADVRDLSAEMLLEKSAASPFIAKAGSRLFTGPRQLPARRLSNFFFCSP